MKAKNSSKLTLLLGYFRNTRVELDKTIFPDKAQMRSAFISVLVVVGFITLLLALFDLLVSLLVSIVL